MYNCSSTVISNNEQTLKLKYFHYRLYAVEIACVVAHILLYTAANCVTKMMPIVIPCLLFEAYGNLLAPDVSVSLTQKTAMGSIICSQFTSQFCNHFPENPSYVYHSFSMFSK
jgi:hypothetical protein